MSGDPFLQDDGLTLRNRLGVYRDPKALKDRESDFTGVRIAQLDAGDGPSGRFDAEHVRALHRFIFQDVYEWAGQTRGDRNIVIEGERISPGLTFTKDQSAFAVSPTVNARLDQLAQKISEDARLRDRDRQAFAEAAADTLAELNAIHPFREGNGRTQRAFVKALGAAHGHEIRFHGISKERMTQVSIDAIQGDRAAMTRMMEEITDPERRSRLETATQFLDKAGYDWNSRYVASTTPRQAYEGVMVGQNRGHFIMHDGGNSIFVGRVTDLETPVQSGERIAFTAKAVEPDAAPQRWRLGEFTGKEQAQDREDGQEPDIEMEPDD